MRKIILVVGILVIITLFSIPVFVNYADKHKIDKVDIRGIVQDITMYGNTTSILVEGMIEDDTTYDKASIKIDSNTVITKGLIGKEIYTSKIKIGDKVEVKFTGLVAESYPVQAVAKSINVIESED
jgi:beta-N-acetylhexosaminidase